MLGCFKLLFLDPKLPELLEYVFVWVFCGKEFLGFLNTDQKSSDHISKQSLQGIFLFVIKVPGMEYSWDLQPSAKGGEQKMQGFYTFSSYLWTGGLAAVSAGKGSRETESTKRIPPPPLKCHFFSRMEMFFLLRRTEKSSLACRVANGKCSLHWFFSLCWPRG